MSEQRTVTYDLDGEIALVGLNRPDKRNCFNPTIMKQLRNAIERAGEEAKCGIIFGHGDNFCAGLDLRWAAENWKSGQSQRLPFAYNRKTYFEEMARGNIPFIAALQSTIIDTNSSSDAFLPNQDGFAELGDGTLTRVVRVVNFGGPATAPDQLYSSRSKDLGRTWSPPTSPRACKRCCG